MVLSQELLDSAWNAGRAAHPDVALDRESFGRYLEPRAAAWKGTLERAPDLYLACACVQGVAHAADVFFARYLSRVPLYLGRLARSADVVDEVTQQLGMRLLVGDDGQPPRLAEYTGRGSLEGWVRVSASRAALNLERGSARKASWTDAVERRLVDEGADLSLLKQAYREPFSRAVAQAAAALSREHRVLLRLHYMEAVTTAQLAALYDVSRPTIVRRIGQACDALVAGAQQRLREALALEPEELDELMNLVRSQLDVSLARLLRETFA